MLRPTIRHRTEQPRDSGRQAPPTEPTESHGGRLGIPTHNYTIFPISLTGSTYTIHLRLIRKCIVDFLFMLIEHFLPGVTDEAL